MVPQHPSDSSSAASIHSEIRQGRFASAGTLMWIGERASPEFADAYRLCESRVAQLAVRRDLGDALNRPAAMVQRILVTRSTRTEFDHDSMQRLIALYPGAEILQLLGSLCSGEAHGRAERFASERVYWHQANQVLPEWLECCGFSEEPSAAMPVRSVAVVASTLSDAHPLLEIVAAAGVVAIWCRQPEFQRTRNIDVVWWDETAARSTSVDVWRQRLRRTDSGWSPPTGQRHAWLVSQPSSQDCRSAYEAGVELIVTKPGLIEPLYQMLVGEHPSLRESDVGDSAARIPADRVPANPASQAA